MEDRRDVLGFQPQKESLYNKLLPYSTKLDAESNDQLAEIKANLGRTVQLRDIKIGASHWTGQLSKYIRLYGHKFSQADHLAFIHLVLQLCLIPHLEYSLVHKFTQLLIALLKKRSLLTRKELVLPWRPLYKLLEAVVYSPYEHHGLVLLPANVELVLKNLVRVARMCYTAKHKKKGCKLESVDPYYFSEDATEEMLQELRPLLCPYDTSMVQGMYFLELFLPTNLPPELHHKGFRLWFDEMMGLWSACHNTMPWEVNLVNLFSRVANDNIGYIDWEPYIPQIFTRVLKSFNLPVGSAGQVLIGRACNGYDVGNVPWWIVGMMGGGSSCLESLSKLFNTLESFYHPSNIGKWNTKLMKFMSKLPAVVVKRLHRERYKKNSWDTPVPEQHRLTNEEVTQFVMMLKPIVGLAMFSKLGSQNSALAVRQLAVLRPEIIIPPLLEKTYPALETLTEPHRLTACLHCLVACGRAMLTNPRWYPEGRMHIVPLLNLCLPGIDPNDFKKCLITMQLISTMTSLVPIVDCSMAVHCRNDLTEEETELCSATAQFEDFVLQFIDRVIGLIENSVQMHTRTDTAPSAQLSHEESVLEMGLLSTLSAVLQQSSAEIFQEAVHRLFHFVSTSMYEIHVSGRLSANLVRAAAKVNAEKALKKFMPHFVGIIKARVEAEDISKEENLDNEFLWNLKLMSECVRCDGSALLPYQDDLLQVLKATLHLKCKDGADLAGHLLRHTLKSMTLVYALDYRCTPNDWNRPLTDYLPLRDWGCVGSLEQLQMKWHIPCEEEKAFATQLLHTILVPELHRLGGHVTGGEEHKLSREELQQSLSIIIHCMTGAGNMLPAWHEEPIKLMDCMVELKRFSNTASADSEGLSLDGANVRLTVAKAMRPLLDHLLLTSEDDTKSLSLLIKVYCCILYFHGSQKDDFDNRWKSLRIVKKSLENKMMGKKKHIRALLVDRVQLQHELRVINRVAKVLTVTHKELLQDLLRLSISRYSEVRSTAQLALGQGFYLFAYSYRALLDDIITYLKDTAAEHHQFKGALHLVLGENRRSLVTKRSWDVMLKIWPALVQAQHSEKPSILQLIDSILDKLHKNIESTELGITVHPALLESGEQMWKTESMPAPSLPPPDHQQLLEGEQRQDSRNQAWLTTYQQLVESLVSQIESGNLMWRFEEMAIEMLGLMVRHDIQLPARAVRLYVRNLLHETLVVRKICLAVISAILKLQKRRHKMVVVNPYEVSHSGCPPTSDTARPGDRPDNVWHHYNSSDPLQSADLFNKTVFVEKTHWGYYTWPRVMKVYAPATEQPSVDRDMDSLRDEEKPIFEHFSQPKFISKLLEYLCLEEDKGKDRFNSKHFILFKGLFRNFGDSFLPLIKPHVERMVNDTSPETHECNHRCASEIVAGLIRGSKHWDYDRVQSMWQWLIPLLKTAFLNLSTESVADWGTACATSSESRDPRKLQPLFELLMDNPVRGEGGSFGDSSRLYVLQGALAQQEWRVPQLLHRCLDYLYPMLPHSYKNVRDRLGSVMVNLFMYDIDLPNGTETSSPRREPFMDKVLAQLNQLLQENDQNNHLANMHISDEVTVAAAAASSGDVEMQVLDGSTAVSNVDNKKTNELKSVDDAGNEERKTAIKLVKTVMKWLQGNCGRMFQCVTPSIFKFVPILCALLSESQDEELIGDIGETYLELSQTSLDSSSTISTVLATVNQMCALESESKDPELRQDCVTTIAFMAQLLLANDQLIQDLLACIKQVVKMNLWHARAAILAYLQVTVFCNFFVLQEPSTKGAIQDLVMQLLCDEQLEVREMAAMTLSGFLHCGYMTVNQDMMRHFAQLSNTGIKKKRRQDSVNPDLLIRRHAGVLGLSACVQAFPYDVPEFIPQILMDLSAHVDDPQPIQMTVKKTLSNFKRTHHDNWQDHKQMFTDDQLVVLTDLLVSPNYYA